MSLEKGEGIDWTQDIQIKLSEICDQVHVAAFLWYEVRWTDPICRFIYFNDHLLDELLIEFFGLLLQVEWFLVSLCALRNDRDVSVSSESYRTVFFFSVEEGAFLKVKQYLSELLEYLDEAEIRNGSAGTFQEEFENAFGEIRLKDFSELSESGVRDFFDQYLQAWSHLKKLLKERNVEPTDYEGLSSMDSTAKEISRRGLNRDFE